MVSTIWGTAGNGEIVIVSLTNDKLEEALNVLRTEFFAQESICKALQLVKNANAVKDVEQLVIDVAKLGCTLIAKDKKTDKVIGVSLNNLQEKDDNLESIFEKYAPLCNEKESRAFVEFMIYVDNRLSLFDHCNVTCLMEIMFLSIHSEYQRKGIGKALCLASIEFARRLKFGERVKVALNDKQKPLHLEPMPQIVSAMFTSSTSQKLGKALGFTRAGEVDYNEYSYKGVSYKTLIGSSASSMTIEYLKL